MLVADRNNFETPKFQVPVLTRVHSAEGNELKVSNRQISNPGVHTLRGKGAACNDAIQRFNSDALQAEMQHTYL